MPKIVDHDQQREALLDACFRAFAREGWASATMRKLAKEAGVSTGKLYHYFPDKQALLADLFALVIRRDTDRVRNTLPDDAPVPQRIHALFNFYREHATYLADLLRLALEVHRHEPSPASRQQVMDSVGQYRAAMADILGVERLVADMAFSFLVGSITTGLLDPGSVDLDAQEAFLQGVWLRLVEEGGAA